MDVHTYMLGCTFLEGFAAGDVMRRLSGVRRVRFRPRSARKVVGSGELSIIVAMIVVAGSVYFTYRVE